MGLGMSRLDEIRPIAFFGCHSTRGCQLRRLLHLADKQVVTVPLPVPHGFPPNFFGGSRGES